MDRPSVAGSAPFYITERPDPMAPRDYRQPGLHDDPGLEAIKAMEKEADQIERKIARHEVTVMVLRSALDRLRDRIAEAKDAHDAGEYDSPLLRPRAPDDYFRQELRRKREQHRQQPFGGLLEALLSLLRGSAWQVFNLVRRDGYFEAIIRLPLPEGDKFDPDAARDEAADDWNDIVDRRIDLFGWVNPPHARHHEAKSARRRERAWLSRGLVQHPATLRYLHSRAPPRRSTPRESRATQTIAFRGAATELALMRVCAASSSISGWAECSRLPHHRGW